MPNPILVRRSAVQNATPTTTQLGLGELAVNTYDGRMFLKRNVLGVESIVAFDALTSANMTAALGSGSLTLGGDPVSDLQAVPKRWMDAMTFKRSARVATPANLTATYNNAAGTLTNSGTLAALNIDSTGLSVGDRVLVRSQTTTTQNGIYSVTTVGSAAIAWVLTRVTGADTWAELTNAYIAIKEGATLVGTVWYNSSALTGTLGTTAITFVQIIQNQINSLGAVATNGILARTAANTITARSLAVSGTGLTVSNADGVSGNPTVTSNATSANTVSTIVARDGSGNFTASTISASLFSAVSTSAGAHVWGAAVRNNSATNGTSVGISIDPANSGLGTRDSQIRAMVLGSGLTNLSFWTSNNAAPAQVMHLNNVGDITVSGRVARFSDFWGEWRWRQGNSGGGTNWKRVADITLPATTFSGINLIVEVTYSPLQWGGTSDVRVYQFAVSAIRSGSVIDDTDSASITGPFSDWVRLAKTAVGVYQLQVRNPDTFSFSSWRVIPASTLLTESAAIVWVSGTPPDDVTSGAVITLPTVSGTGIISTNRADITHQLTLSVANGTAPMAVTSTTLVSNLNADLLDGFQTNTGTTANTIPVRDGTGAIPGSILGNAATATALAATVSFSIAGSEVTSNTVTTALGSGASVALTAVLATQGGLTAGTYTSVTANSKGIITAASNPVTFSTAVAGWTDQASVALGGTATNEHVFRTLQITNNNTDRLITRAQRLTTGTDWTTAVWDIRRRVDTSDMGFFRFGGSSTHRMAFGFNATERLVITDTTLQWNGNTIWHAGNDGTGSGLDADLLDGYATSTGTTLNTIPVRNASGQLPGDITGNAGTATSAAALTTNVTFALVGSEITSNTQSTNLSSGVAVQLTAALATQGGLTAGTYTSLTVNSKGLVTAATNPTTFTISGTGTINQASAVLGTTGGNAHVFDTSRINAGGNVTNLITRAVRYSNGTDWTTSGFQIVRLVDATTTAAINFGPANAQINLTDGVSNTFQLLGSALTFNGNTIWHAGNDGSGSGLDADLLDGLNAASGATASTIVSRDSSGNSSFSNVNIVGGATGINWSSYGWGIYTGSGELYTNAPRFSVYKTNTTGAPLSINGTCSAASANAFKGAVWGLTTETDGAGTQWGPRIQFTKQGAKNWTAGIGRNPSIGGTYANSFFITEDGTETADGTWRFIVGTTESLFNNNLIVYGSLNTDAAINGGSSISATTTLSCSGAATVGTTLVVGSTISTNADIYSSLNMYAVTTISCAGTMGTSNWMYALGNDGAGYSLSITNSGYSGGNFISASDIRFKEDIETFADPIRTLMSLRGVRYRDKKGEREYQLGFIAQEVLPVAPELVRFYEHPKTEGSYEDFVGHSLALDYSRFTVILVEAAKNHELRIEAEEAESEVLREQVASQKKEIEDLTTKLARLERLCMVKFGIDSY